MVSYFERRTQITGTVFRKIFAPKNDDVSEKFRTLRYEELGDLYRSAGIVRILKCRRL
jgi:hypothetical protein